MGILIAIDFGLKRTGLAVTDDLQLIASGLDTVESISLMDTLKGIVNSEKVDGFVIGQAKRMSGEDSAIEQNILDFIKALHKTFPIIPVHRQDERFTSKLAMQAMISGGVKKRDRRNKQKGLVDKVSATLILQAYLENQ